MKHKIINPVIPGFYPDPSICRVGDDFYIACSSFELYPGIPVFHSRNLADWEQIGHAMTAENEFHVEKNGMVGGVMAPTIRFHDGMFYIINTNFSDRGNYIITAENPAGPWSKPHWMDDVPGIDASIFFDDDGRCYVLGTGEVWDNGAGKKERGIWLAEYDIKNFRMAGEPVTIFNSALRVGAAPESPHLYHVGEYYHLVIAEGGTEHYHAVMTARSRELFGFYEGNPANPVMTHRHMGHRCPITNVGHADLVELADGSWYAVLLASRLIGESGKNLGRETFLCPVKWERDWPLFSPATGKIEWEYPAPLETGGEFHAKENVRDDFLEDKLSPDFCFYGRPYGKFYEIGASKLSLQCIRQSVTDEIRPVGFAPEMNRDAYAAFVGRRQQNIHTTAACQMQFLPHGAESAGMAVMQSMNHQYHLERAVENGKQVVQLVLYRADYDRPPYVPGFICHTKREVLVQRAWSGADIILQIQMAGETFTVRVGAREDELIELYVADGNLINTEQVGCMAGTMVGMFASGHGTDSSNRAIFDWFELR